MAHFEFAPGSTSRAGVHRTVEETGTCWVARGRMWRRQGTRAEIVSLRAGGCLKIPLGTAFQLRVTGSVALTAVAITMPPWPGEGEAEFVEGAWRAD